MSLFALGINHHTAPVSIREQVAVDGARLAAALTELAHRESIREVAIVSTCNRMEIYSLVDADIHSQLFTWLHRFHRLPEHTLEAYVYQLNGIEVPRHLFRVAAGLDSMVIGEPQILGQVKTAYRIAKEQQYTGPGLDHLFQHAFSAAKKIRSQTAIGEKTLSIAATAVKLARQIFSDLSKQRALLIGAGDTIELLAQHLHSQGLCDLIIANRSRDKAEALADRFDGQAIGLAELPQHLGRSDMVFSSTSSDRPIVTRSMVEKALSDERRHPVLMVDLAVPRDIEPQVAGVSDIYLYSLDDLQNVVEAGRNSRLEAAQAAHEIIEREVHACMAWMEGRGAVQLLRSFRSQAEKQRDEILDRAKRLLKTQHNTDQALEYLANTLSNKLLHAPTRAIKLAGMNGDQDLLDAARTLLDIHAEKPDASTD